MNVYTIPGVKNRENTAKVSDYVRLPIHDKIIKASKDVISQKELTEYKREKLAMQIAIYLIRRDVKSSYYNLSYLFNKDHATCIYSFKTIAGLVEVDKEIKSYVTEVENCIKYFD